MDHSPTNIPTEQSAIVAATDWGVQLLWGSLGTAIAVIAIAMIGLTMLQGRISLRDASRAILGCFILFGAPLIAQGLMQASRQATTSSVTAPAPAQTPPLNVPTTPQSFDPYAGASAPTQH